MLRQVLPTGPLGGVRVGVTAGRGGRRVVDAMRRAGAVVAWGPTFDTVAATPARLRAETKGVLERGPRWLGVTTERGVRVWADGAGPLGPALRDLLGGAGIVARNRAAARAVAELGGRAEVTAASGRGAEVARLLLERTPGGGPVAVQVDGGGSRTLVGHLREAGAEVLVIRPHRWEPPADVGPAARLVRQIAAGDLDIVTFTSPPAVDGLFEVAAGLGRGPALAAALGGTTAAAALGPATARALEARGVRVAACPAQASVEALVAAVATWRVTPEGREPVALDPARRTARRGDHQVPLTELEFALLRSLSRRAGATCPTPVLVREVWGSHCVQATQASGDRRRLEVLVSRLRARLSPLDLSIAAVPKRGYRLVESGGERRTPA